MNTNRNSFAGFTRSLRRAVNRAAKATEAHADTCSPGRRRALLRSGEQGQAMLETALILPAWLAILTAIFTFAVAFNNQLILTSAVGSGAEYLQTRRSVTSDPCADALAAIEAAAPNFTAANIVLTLNINGTVVSGQSCPSSTATLVAAEGDPVSVKATYPCLLSIMSMNPAYGSRFVSNCQISAKVTEYQY
jgi:Flp pilus assembly protein TadG